MQIKSIKYDIVTLMVAEIKIYHVWNENDGVNIFPLIWLIVFKQIVKRSYDEVEGDDVDYKSLVDGYVRTITAVQRI